MALHSLRIGRAEFRYLFPDAVIRNERLLGLTKSIIEIRSDLHE